LLSSAPDRPVGPATRNLFSGLLAHRGAQSSMRR
jgi:hypothetical protein